MIFGVSDGAYQDTSVCNGGGKSLWRRRLTPLGSLLTVHRDSFPYVGLGGGKSLCTVRASKERDACVGAEASLRPLVLLRDILLVEKHRYNRTRIAKLVISRRLLNSWGLSTYISSVQCTEYGGNGVSTSYYP